MEQTKQTPKALQDLLAKASTASGNQIMYLVQNTALRRFIEREVEKSILKAVKTSRSDPNRIPGIEEDKAVMGLALMGSVERALRKDRLSQAYLSKILQIFMKALFVDGGDRPKMEKFMAEYNMRAPSFLLISPTKACNLRCTGCYADSNENMKALEWSLVDRMMNEALELWGDRFFVISGGEPFAYRSEGKTLLDLVEKHDQCGFMVYTNGTLITEEISKRLSQAGNVFLCISVEGWRERTDERRGKGVFDKVLSTMKLLREDGVPFGISLTGTRYNAEEILSDEFIDFFIEQGALFAWLFQYMPIGRSYTLDLMVTPQQRTWMWHRSWEIVREKRFFLADFWNHGTTCDGCLSAGGHGAGGYFYIDWNGAISPCVFMPYSPLNIHDIYAQGKNLNDVWQEPFFKSLRQWQLNYKAEKRNGLAPCPNRDHHDELEELLRKYEPEPIDANAAETLTDPKYTSGLKAYNLEFESLTKDIWENYYLHRSHLSEDIPPLPDIPEEAQPKTDQGTRLEAPQESVPAD